MVLNLPPQVNTVIAILSAAGHSAYAVGGAVRDLLRGVEPQDWDVTTNALPEETAACFADYRVIETGIKHGTVTVLLDGMPLEITTYRLDGGYSDHRHPDSVTFTDRVEEDLARRDLTINAMAYSPQRGLCDPFGGMEDLQARRIRCVGDPVRRFDEDALRILRAIRFASTLGFAVDPATDAAIRSGTPLLAAVSAERIFTELRKLLCGDAAAALLRSYADVLFFLMPALAPMRGCAQHHERHIHDVWEHTLAAVDAVDPVPHLRLAALLHDSGKPQCRTTDAQGIDHFYGHAGAGMQIADAILRQYKTSNQLRQQVCTLVEYHDFVPHLLSRRTYRKYIHLLGEDAVRDLFRLREADLRAQNPAFLEEGLAQNAAGLAVVDALLAETPAFGLRDLAVRGDDLAAAGIPPSPAMGAILTRLLDEVQADKLKNEKDALLARAKELESGKETP